MQQDNPRPELDQVAYQIQVEGRLDECWSEWFNSMTIAFDQEDDRSSITTLTGVVDHSALHGILARIRDLNLKLVSVTQIKAPKHQKGESDEKIAENGVA
jgi:hypothetical protein